jgi:hypothetical protein
VLLAAGCGSEADEAQPGGGGGQPEATAPATELTITVWPKGRDGASQELTLTCEPAGGTHPSPEKACLALAGNIDALAPLPPDTICTQIYGGPEEAEIAGTFQGREVTATFSRQNGCEIDRWDRLAGVLQAGGLTTITEAT